MSLHVAIVGHVAGADVGGCSIRARGPFPRATPGRP